MAYQQNLWQTNFWFSKKLHTDYFKQSKYLLFNIFPLLKKYHTFPKSINLQIAKFTRKCIQCPSGISL